MKVVKSVNGEEVGATASKADSTKGTVSSTRDETGSTGVGGMDSDAGGDGADDNDDVAEGGVGFDGKPQILRDAMGVSTRPCIGSFLERW